MTVDELEALIQKHLQDGPLAGNRETDETEHRMVRAVAEWMHFDEAGFAKSDLVHMQLECQILMDGIWSLRGALDDLAAHARDTEDDAK